MALKDLSFNLGMNTSKFDRSMKGAQQEFKKFGAMRIDGIRKEMADLSKLTDKVSRKKFTALGKELAMLNKSADAMGKSVSKSAKSFGLLKNVLQGVGQGIGQKLFSGVTGMLSKGVGGVVGFFEESFKAGIDGMQVDAALQNALKNAGKSDAWMDPLKKHADRLRRVFNVDDEAVKGGMNALITGGMTPEEAMKQSNLMVNLAAKKKISIVEAGRIIAKVYNGELKALKGIDIFLAKTGDTSRDVTNAFKLMHETTKGAAAAQAATDAPWTRLAIAWEELKQELGQNLLPAIEPMLKTLGDMMNAFIESGEFKKTVDSIGKYFNMFIAFFGDLGKGFNFKAIFASIWEVVSQIGSFIFDLLVHAGAMIGEEIRKALPAALGGGLTADEKTWQKMEQKFAGKDLVKERARAQSSIRNPLPFGVGTVEAQKELDFFDAKAAGKTRFGGPQTTFGSIINEHKNSASQVANSASGKASNYMDDLAYRGALQAEMDRRGLLRDGVGEAPGTQSAKVKEEKRIAADKEAEKKRLAAHKASSTYVKAHNLNRSRLTIESYGGQPSMSGITS
jgi:hypothetical protein